MSRFHFEFDHVKGRIPRGKVFDSFLRDAETGDSPADGESSFCLEVGFQPVKENVRATLEVDLSYLR